MLLDEVLKKSMNKVMHVEKQLFIPILQRNVVHFLPIAIRMHILQSCFVGVFLRNQVVFIGQNIDKIKIQCCGLMV